MPNTLPTPVNTYQPGKLLTMGKPPQIIAAKPYMMFRLAKVMMKVGMLNFCLAHAWKKPMPIATAMATTRPTTAPSSMGIMPASASHLEMEAVITAHSATCEPTDRSISPARMTRHMP